MLKGEKIKLKSTLYLIYTEVINITPKYSAKHQFLYILIKNYYSFNHPLNSKGHNIRFFKILKKEGFKIFLYNQKRV